MSKDPMEGRKYFQKVGMVYEEKRGASGAPLGDKIYILHD